MQVRKWRRVHWGVEKITKARLWYDLVQLQLIITLILTFQIKFLPKIDEFFSELNSKGTYQYATSKHRLIGSWASGKLTVGSLELPDGKTLEGSFNENQPNGTMTWKCDGEVESTVNYVQTQYPVNDGDDAVTKIRLAVC